VLVFNCEDQFAEIGMDGKYTVHMLPHHYPINAIHGPENNTYLSYGPHQSYWPTVYIWGARDGILTIDSRDLSFYDRRIPRQALQMVLHKDETLYFTQNNWGTEEQFLGFLPDGVRLFEAERNIYLGEKVSRETSQKILRYAPSLSQLYLVKAGESAGERSVLQIINTDSNKVIRRIEVGQTATDLIFDDTNIYISNYDSGTSTIIDRSNFEARDMETGRGPLRLQQHRGKVYVLNNLDNSIQEINPGNKTYKLPGEGKADNIFPWRNRLIITSHGTNSFSIFSFNPSKESFTLVNKEKYPYGDTSLQGENASFFMRGQFGDAVFSLNEAIITGDDRLWITDFLSGKVFVLREN
jgi:DNA-binding beta-propeller fold protein YncE